MRPTVALLTAACMTAGFAFAAMPVSAADMSPAQPTAARSMNATDSAALTFPAGIQAKDLKAAGDVQDAFKNVADYAFGKDPLNNIISCTVDQDRERLKATDKSTDKNADALTSIVSQLDSAWKSKYNGDFAIDKTKVFTSDFLRIETGEVTNPDQLVGQWPLPANPASNMSASRAGDVTAADAQKAHKTFGGDVNLEKGRNVAIAHIPGSHGMPGITASLIHELPSSYRFDIPNTVTREKLHANLVANLTHLYNNRANWPADYNEAYRAASHAVVAALYDVNLDQAMNNMPQASTPMLHGNTTNLPKTANER